MACINYLYEMINYLAMAGFVLGWVDVAVILLFFAIVFLIGIVEKKKVTLEDYWVNGRKTGKYVLVATMLSTFVGAGAILANSAIT